MTTTSGSKKKMNVFRRNYSELNDDKENITSDRSNIN
jgi:hypothetical protein